MISRPTIYNLKPLQLPMSLGKESPIDFVRTVSEGSGGATEQSIWTLPDFGKLAV